MPQYVTKLCGPWAEQSAVAWNLWHLRGEGIKLSAIPHWLTGCTDIDYQKYFTLSSDSKPDRNEIINCNWTSNNILPSILLNFTNGDITYYLHWLILFNYVYDFMDCLCSWPVVLFSFYLPGCWYFFNVKDFVTLLRKVRIIFLKLI